MRALRSMFGRACVSIAVLGLFTAVIPASPASAAPARPTFTITPIVTGLNLPWDVAQTPDGTLIFDQRMSGLSVRRTNGTVGPLNADFSDLFASGETGLMGLVLDPSFASNRRFYTCQGHQDATGKEIQVIAWTVNTGYTAATRVADPLLGDIPVNAGTGRHGGCRLRFDSTSSLLVSTGDNAVGSFPQDLTSLAGKILRINPLTGAPRPPAIHGSTRRTRTPGCCGTTGTATRKDSRCGPTVRCSTSSTGRRSRTR